MELQEWEKQLLLEAYPTLLEKSRIQSGKLYSYMIQSVEEMRGFKDYLIQKYGNQQFNIIRFVPQSTQQANPFYSFEIEGLKEHYHGMLLEEGYCDDYYSLELSKVYDTYLKSKLDKANIAYIDLHSFFKGLVGKETLELEKIIHTTLPIRNTEIFVSENAASIQEAITKLQLVGAYRIYCAKEFLQQDTMIINYDTCWAYYKENPDKVKVTSFVIKEGE